MNGHIASLQQQVDDLYANISALRDQVDGPLMRGSPYDPNAYSTSMAMPQANMATPTDPVLLRPPEPNKPRYRGSTSASFTLGVARSSLQNMGIMGPEEAMEDGGDMTQDATPMGSPPQGHAVPTPLKQIAHATKDPIWVVSKEEANRLVHVWQEEIGMMYPVVDMEKMQSHINMLYTFVEAAQRTGLMQMAMPGADAIRDDQTSMLKLILACALMLEGSGKSDLGKRMFEHVRLTVEAQITAPASIIGVQMLTLAVCPVF